MIQNNKMETIEMDNIQLATDSDKNTTDTDMTLTNISFVNKIKKFFKKPIDTSERIITYNKNCDKCDIIPDRKYTKNVVNNQKYSLLTFIPKFLYEQFNQFWNIYFLVVALTQIPIKNSIFEELWVGFWWTWALPLGFVLCIALIRELFDDFNRMLRDRKINLKYIKKLLLNNGNIINIKSSDIKIGDLIILNENDVVPCDMVLIWCSNKKGNTFIRTDQLDGETDWKLRNGISSIKRRYKSIKELGSIVGELNVEGPKEDIYKFIGTFKDDNNEIEGLNLENTLWGSTVIASGTIVGLAIYTGNETKSMLNSNDTRMKLGRIDQELNNFGKILFLILVTISVILTFGRGVNAKFYLFFGRFMLLLSAIIPISLRVHMDLAKIFFSYMITIDKKIPDTTGVYIIFLYMIYYIFLLCF